MTEAQSVKQPPDIRAVDRNPAARQRHAQFIQRHLAVLLHKPAHEVGVRAELAGAGTVPLPARRKRARLGLQLHQIVHEAGRNPEMARSLTVAVAFLHKRSNANTQLHRMRLAHRGSPFNRNESPKPKSVNPFNRNPL
jgi:hypothetical protein